jgi:hypothetical protein
MRLLFLSLLLAAVASCSRQAAPPPPAPSPEPMACFTDYPLNKTWVRSESEKVDLARPGFTLTGYALSPYQVRLSWKKKGQAAATIYRKPAGSAGLGDLLSQAASPPWIDQTAQPSTAYTYTAVVGNQSASVTVTTPAPPFTYRNVVLLDFDGGIVSTVSWYGLNGYPMPGSGLTETEIALVVDSARVDYAPFDVLITTDEDVFNQADPDRRQRIYITEYWQWYGAAGGVAFLGSLKFREPAFVFSSLLAYRTRDIDFVIAHELAHTLDVRHVMDMSSNNITAANYQIEDHVFGQVLDNLGNFVNQPAAIGLFLN